MKLVPRHKGWTIYASWTINFSAVHSNGSAYKRDQANESLTGYRHWLKHPESAQSRRLTRPT